MRLRFVKMNPAGNTTILVLEPVAVADHARTAVALMSPSVLGGEQVGFVTLSVEDDSEEVIACEPGSEVAASLRMMGGEFCGNASRALGAYIAYRRLRGLEWEVQGRVARGLIGVSGATEPIEVRTELDGNGMPCWSQCTFPGPFRVLLYRRARDGRSDRSSTFGLSREAAYEVGSPGGAARCAEAGGGVMASPKAEARAAESEAETSQETEQEAESDARTARAAEPAAGQAPASATDSAARGGAVSATAVVHLPGITHVVVDAGAFPPSEGMFFQLRRELGLEQEPCVGAMFCYARGDSYGHRDRSGDCQRRGMGMEQEVDVSWDRVVPLVHVSSTGTTVWESSCASGAVAVAMARSVATARSGRFASRQPGGVLYTTVRFLAGPGGGRTAEVRLEGDVRVVAEGEVFL